MRIIAVLQNIDADDANLFANRDKMLNQAAGSAFSNTGFVFERDDRFRFRLYFNLPGGQPLLESPVLDDITFVFAASRPRILYWTITQE